MACFRSQQAIREDGITMKIRIREPIPSKVIDEIRLRGVEAKIQRERGGSVKVSIDRRRRGDRADAARKRAKGDVGLTILGAQPKKAGNTCRVHTIVNAARMSAP